MLTPSRECQLHVWCLLSFTKTQCPKTQCGTRIRQLESILQWNSCAKSHWTQDKSTGPNLGISMFSESWINAPFSKALDSEMKRNKATPSAVRVPKQADSVWEEDIPWQKGLHGSHSPQSLVNAMVFMAGLYLHCIMGKNISSCTKISTLLFVCRVPQEYVSHPPHKPGMPRSLLCRDVQKVMSPPTSCTWRRSSQQSWWSVWLSIFVANFQT